MSSKIIDEIQKYVDEVCVLIRNKKVHKSIKEEIANHIEELTLDYIDVGLSEEEAVRKAIEQMGSAAVIGRDLNKIHRAAPDWIVLGLTAIFVSIGLFVLWFIQENNIISSEFFYTNYFKNSMIYVISGILLGVIIFKIDYRDLQKYSRYVYIGGCVLLISTFFFGKSVNGALEWIRIGNISLNTLLVSPYLIIIALGGMFEKWDWGSRRQILIGLALAVIPAPLFILARSSVNFIIYFMGAMTVIIMSGIKIKHVIYAFSGMVTVIGTLILIEPYRIERFMAMFNLERDPMGYGWIYMKIAELSKDAGLFGQGAELSKNILPEIHTDFVFTFIVYCFGWIVGILLIILICAFIVRIGFVGSKVKDRYGKLIVCGFCALISTQFILAIFASLNVLPIFSVSMPFISYGGSSLVINILSISLISNVFKWRNTPYKVLCR